MTIKSVIESSFPRYQQLIYRSSFRSITCARS